MHLRTSNLTIAVATRFRNIACTHLTIRLRRTYIVFDIYLSTGQQLIRNKVVTIRR